MGTGQAGAGDTINLTGVGASSGLQTVELQSGEIVSVEGTAGDDTIQLLINRCHRQRAGHLPRRGASDIMNG